MAITIQLNTRAGSGTITLSASSGATSFPTTTGEVEEISSMEIDYDLEEDTEDVSNIFYAPSEFDVTLFDGLENGGSLIALLDNYLSTTTLYLDFSFTTDGGYSFSSKYEFDTSDIEADRITRTVEIKAKLVFGGNMTVSQLFDAYPNDVETLAMPGGLECMPAVFFIENALSELVPDSSTIDIKNNTQVFEGNPYTDQKTSFVVLQSQEYETREQEDKIDSMLYRLATMDGSIMASMMGYHYLCHRNSTSDSETITSDDVSEISKMIGLEDYRSVQVMVNNYRTTYMANLGEYRQAGWVDWFAKTFKTSDKFNQYGNKTLSVYLNAMGVFKAVWDTASSTFNGRRGRLVSQLSSNVESDSSPTEGDLIIPVDSDPSLDAGEVICFNEYVHKPHIVSSSNSTRILLETPLQHDIESTDERAIYRFLGESGTINNSFFTEGAVEAYSNAYGANGQERFEFTILDMDKLDPYQPVYLDNSFRDEYADRYIQPSKLEYDLMGDKIEVEGYEIG